MKIALFAALVIIISAVTFGTNTEGSDGYIVNLSVNTVTEQQVRDWMTGAGYEDGLRLIQVDVVDTGATMAAVGGNCLSICHPADAKIQVTDDFLLSTPNYALAHEYGHVWANFYKWTYWGGSWDAYLEARGLLGDSRLGSTMCWRTDEIIAEDYRTLFGSGEALTLGQCNKSIPKAVDVPGLKDFLALTWTNGHPPPGYDGTVPPTATPTETAVPTATSTPVATNTPAATPTPMPTVCNAKGKGCH